MLGLSELSTRLAEATVEVGEGLPRRTRDAAPDQDSIKDAAPAGAWLVGNDDPVGQVAVDVLEVALVTRIGQPVLHAYVFHRAVWSEQTERHLQLHLPAEEPQYEPRLVPGLSPARPGLDPHEVGPVLRPVARIGDVVESLPKRDTEAPVHLDANRLRHRPVRVGILGEMDFELQELAQLAL